jgi:hypothetical protein
VVSFVSRWEHQYTLQSLEKGDPVIRRSYDGILRRTELPLGAYIFTDIDRLGVWELELASILYRTLQAGGARVLNDPARVLTRFDMLRTLYEKGLNRYQVWRPYLDEWPDRYPVFVRRNAFHSGVLSELIHDKSGLEKVLDEKRREGIPDSNVIVVEYAAQSDPNGLFRKFSVYRVGDRYFNDLSVNQKNWEVKYGESGVASEAIYQLELDMMNQVPFKSLIRKVFDIAHIEYGRLDFGLVDGCPQFYEINTNPTLRLSMKSHPFPQRMESHRIYAANFRTAVRALDMRCKRNMIPLNHVLLQRHRNLAKPKSWSPPTL